MRCCGLPHPLQAAGQLDALLVWQDPCPARQVDQLRPLLTHPGGAAAPVVSAFCVRACLAATAAESEQTADLICDPAQAVADALDDGLHRVPHAADNAGDPIKDRLHHIENGLKDADGDVDDRGNDRPCGGQNVCHHRHHRTDDLLDPAHLASDEGQHGADLLADAVEDDLEHRSQGGNDRPNALYQPGNDRSCRTDHLADGAHHRLDHRQHRGDERLHGLYDAGDGGHDRYAHLLQGGLDRGPETGQLRLHCRKAALEVPDGVEEVIHDATHAGGKKADDAIPQALDDPCAQALDFRGGSLKAGLDSLRQGGDDTPHHGNGVVQQEGGSGGDQLLHGAGHIPADGHIPQQVLRGGFHCGEGAAEGLAGFLGRCPRHAQVFLDGVDGIIYIGQVVDVVLGASKLLCVRQEPLHLLFGAAVPQLQVVQHSIVLLGEALVSVLDGLHIGAELVCVVRHVDQGHVRDGGRLCGVTAQAADQRGGEAGHLLHIGVGGEARCAECCVRIGLYHTGIFLEQGLHAADALLQRSPLADGTAHDHRDRQCHRDGHRLCQACQLALDFG